ncbi:MAG TPA: hypothetical protein VLR26_04825 [Frankiaceae bacterium]|nr:hypothetical protein [Frankiaceae bacterium]
MVVQEPESSAPWLPPEGNRSRQTLLRALAALGIAVAFAVVLGLVIVAFSKGVGSNGSSSRPAPPALTIPAAGGTGPGSAVPADWVEQTSNQGIVFRAPPGWTQRVDASIDFRVEPSASGPGVGQVGVGLSAGTTDPDAAATNYATSTYSGQSSFQQQPPTDVVSARGERGRQVLLSYSRSGTPVIVAIRAFPTGRGVLLVVSRAPASDQQRADRLASAVDTSIRLP